MTTTNLDRANAIAHQFVGEHFEKLLCNNRAADRYDEDRAEVTKYLGQWIFSMGGMVQLDCGYKLAIKVRTWSTRYYTANYACPSHTPALRLDLCQCLCQCLLEYAGFDMEAAEWQMMQSHYDIAYTALRYTERNINRVPDNPYRP
ncbi:MAG: hypothetical protein JWP57_1541 [Spirosoma sp.]|nr:hypothetical protein [Spirosoma sp.]